MRVDVINVFLSTLTREFHLSSMSTRYTLIKDKCVYLYVHFRMQFSWRSEGESGTCTVGILSSFEVPANMSG